MNKRNARPTLAQRLKDALTDVIEHADTRKPLVTTLLPAAVQYSGSDVLRIRQQRSLSQRQFARLLAVSVRTLQSWEQGLRTPSGPSMRLLQVFDRPHEFEFVLGVAEKAEPYGS